MTLPSVTTIADVVDAMKSIDAALPSSDGVKWFNLLYLKVTETVQATPPNGGWADPATLAALFESRYRPDVQRIQFALAGMNAHINRDLPYALVTTCADRGIAPDPDSPLHTDYETVNDVLARVEPEAEQFLATGIEGEIAQDMAPLGSILSMWSIRTARDTAWTNAELLWLLRDDPSVRDRFGLVLDRLTGFAGRGLLVSVE
jgi:hypothetical protein